MDIKETYWNYFISSKDYPKPRGCTKSRLEKIKQTMFEDKFFWQDILYRHGCAKYTNPEDYKKAVSKEIYQHCIGNFYGMIFERMILHKVVS